MEQNVMIKGIAKGMIGAGLSTVVLFGVYMFAGLGVKATPLVAFYVAAPVLIVAAFFAGRNDNWKPFLAGFFISIVGFAILGLVTGGEASSTIARSDPVEALSSSILVFVKYSTPIVGALFALLITIASGPQTQQHN